MEREFAATAVVWLTAWIPHLLAALALLFAGFWLAGTAQSVLLRLMDRQRGIDTTLRGVLGAVVRYAVLILFLVAAVGQLGFQMGSILAVLATAGLAVGLALQATLANIAAGVMLLWLRPFRIGDQIEAGSAAGRVVEVGLFACELHSPDGVFQFVPNSELWNKRLVNYSRLPRRLVSARIQLTDPAALPVIRAMLAERSAGDPRWLAEPKPDAFASELSDDKIIVTAQVWTNTANYAALARELPEALLACAVAHRARKT